MKKGSKKRSTKTKNPNEQKTATLFDHLNQIYAVQNPNYFDTLSESDKKSYNKYMINRFLSMNVEYALVVNIVQKYTDVSNETHYKFLINVIPKRKQFNKYIKSSVKESYENWLIELLAKHFLVSKAEAITYLDILYSTDFNKTELRKLLQMYGTDEKKYKEAHL